MEFGILGPLEVRDGGGPGAGAGGQGAGPAGRPGGQRRPGGVGRPAGRGPVGRGPAGQPGQHPPGPGVGAAPGPGAGRVGAGWSPARPATALEVGPGAGGRGPVRAAGRRGRRPGARRSGPRAARLLEEALGLWRGPALAEFADRPWAQAEAARLEELRLAAREALAELALAAGGHAGLVGELEALVAGPPDPGAAPGPADGGPVPVGPPGRRAGAVPADPRGAGRGAGDRPVAGAAAACTRRSWSRTRPWRRPGPTGAAPGTTCPSA